MSGQLESQMEEGLDFGLTQARLRTLPVRDRLADNYSSRQRTIRWAFIHFTWREIPLQPTSTTGGSFLLSRRPLYLNPRYLSALHLRVPAILHVVASMPTKGLNILPAPPLAYAALKRLVST